MIQLSPPLIAGQAEFDEIVGILGDVLDRGVGRASPAVVPGDTAGLVARRGAARPAAAAARGRAPRPTSRSSAAATRGCGRRWRCRRASPALDVVVLEAELCGFGPSGRNGGFLEALAGLVAAARAVGDDGALAVARAVDGRRSPAVRAHGEDVWLREGGLLMVSAAPAQDAVVDEAVAAAARARRARGGGPARRPSEVAARCARRASAAACFFRDGATVQPARLVRALRRAALAARRARCTRGRARTRIARRARRDGAAARVRARDGRRRDERVDDRLAAASRGG